MAFTPLQVKLAKLKNGDKLPLDMLQELSDGNSHWSFYKGKQQYKLADHIHLVSEFRFRRWKDREGWLVVHAGLEPGKPLEDQNAGKMNRIRFLHPETRKTVSLDDNYQPPAGSVYWTEAYDLPYSVVYGHNVHSFTKPEVTRKEHGPTLVGIDTGACFGGRLRRFLSVGSTTTSGNG